MLRQATAAAYNGVGFRNEASHLVDEYIERKRLRKLGIVTSGRDIPAWKVDALIAIDCKVDELRERDQKRNR